MKKKLPNIISIESDGWNSSILLRIMIAMIRQKNTNADIFYDKMNELFNEIYLKNPQSIKVFEMYRKSK